MAEHRPAIIAKSYLDLFRAGYINSTHGFKLNRQFLFILPSTRRFNKPSDFPPCSINPGRDCPTICSRFSSVFLPYSVCDLLPSFRESFLSRGNSSPLFLNTNRGPSTAKRSEKTRIFLNACLRSKSRRFRSNSSLRGYFDDESRFPIARTLRASRRRIYLATGDHRR